jgi:hypothetical protein
MDGVERPIGVGKRIFAFFIKYLKKPIMSRQNRRQMALNVPVVYDGLTARISKTAGFAGLANCGGVRRGNGEAMT